MPRTYVSGVAMTPFSKPASGDKFEDLGANAVRMALADACLNYADLQEAFCGYTMGDTSSGQRALYGIGLTGIPIINVNNSCASGSSALYMARRAVHSGQVDCALALGFEQMQIGAMTLAYPDRSTPFDRHEARITEMRGPDFPLSTIGWFAAAAQDYMASTGMKAERFAQIAVKARKHAQHNPRAVFREPLTLEEVLQSKMIADPLTKFQCSPPTNGAAAAIICSENFARKHGLSRTVEITGQALATDMPSAFSGTMIDVVGREMALKAIAAAYAEAGVGPEDIDVIELHDCFTSNEVITYELLGLAKPGEAEKLIVDGDNSYGGRWVINPSGGLIAKGHPIGATGLAQCFELTLQLRGAADARQVADAQTGLQHNLGIGGACVVTIYQRSDMS